MGTALQVFPDTLVAVDHSPSLDADHALTIEGWVRLARLPSSRGRMIDKHRHYGLSITSSGAVRCGGGGAPTLSGGAVEPGTWTHVACVFDWDARARRVYIDGDEIMQVSANSVLEASTEEQLIIGGDSPCEEAPCDQVLEGAIDQVRLWRAVRTAADLCEAAGRDRCDEHD